MDSNTTVATKQHLCFCVLLLPNPAVVPVCYQTLPRLLCATKPRLCSCMLPNLTSAPVYCQTLPLFLCTTKSYFGSCVLSNLTLFLCTVKPYLCSCVLATLVLLNVKTSKQTCSYLLYGKWQYTTTRTLLQYNNFFHVLFFSIIFFSFLLFQDTNNFNGHSSHLTPATTTNVMKCSCKVTTAELSVKRDLR